jgi:hypothetical protein
VTVSRCYKRVPLYLMTFQGHWEAQIYQTTLPLWLRVYALAMARSEPNLHTGIGPQELAVLGSRMDHGNPLIEGDFGKRFGG